MTQDKANTEAHGDVAVAVAVETEVEVETAAAVQAEVEPEAPSPPDEALPSGGLNLNLKVKAAPTLEPRATRGSARGRKLGLDLKVHKHERDHSTAESRESSHTRRLERTASSFEVEQPIAQLAKRDQVILERLERLTHVMDNLLPIPGTRFRVGLDPILGLVPILGDCISGAVSVVFLIESIRLGAKPRHLVKMVGHLAVDLAFGFLPLIGDVFDSLYKANERNLDLLKDQVLNLNAMPEIEDKTEPETEEPSEKSTAIVDMPLMGGDSVIEEDGEPAEAVSYAEEDLALAPAQRQVLVQPPREATAMSKAIGFTLIFGIVTVFVLPWAYLFYWIFFS